jgi:phosphohistidine phosphatase
MLLALVRHGVAEDAGPATDWRDEPRRLTARGAERMRRAAEGVATLGIAPEVILSSPLPRCEETATIIGTRLGAPVRTHAAMRPGARLDGLLDVLAEYPDAPCVMACGHQPDLSLMAAELLGGGIVEFRKGTLALLESPGLRPAGAVLVGLYGPRILRRLGGA